MLNFILNMVEKMKDKIHKIGDTIYAYLLQVIDKYQENYKGPEKMSKEYMMKEIEKFKNKEIV